MARKLVHHFLFGREVLLIHHGQSAGVLLAETLHEIKAETREATLVGGDRRSDPAPTDPERKSGDA